MKHIVYVIGVHYFSFYPLVRKTPIWKTNKNSALTPTNKSKCCFWNVWCIQGIRVTFCAVLAKLWLILSKTCHLLPRVSPRWNVWLIRSKKDTFCPVLANLWLLMVKTCHFVTSISQLWLNRGKHWHFLQSARSKEFVSTQEFSFVPFG